jgi:hypothetical protein
MSFARTLSSLVKKAKTTCYELSEESGIDYKHVKRLMSGESSHPARSTVLRLGQALLYLSGKISLDDVDDLLDAAGKGPAATRTHRDYEGHLTCKRCFTFLAAGGHWA